MSILYSTEATLLRAGWCGSRECASLARLHRRKAESEKKREKPFRARRGAAGGPLVNVDSGNARAMVLSRQRLRCAAGRRASDSFGDDDFYFAYQGLKPTPEARIRAALLCLSGDKLEKRGPIL